MKHTSRSRGAGEGLGGDSFLDIVANMVGILVILVMIIGSRVAHSARDDHPQAPHAGATDRGQLDSLESEAAALEHDIRGVEAKMAEVTQLAAARQHERHALATLLTAGQQQLDQQRQTLDAGSRDELDLRGRLQEGRLRLASLNRDMAAEQDAPEPTVHIVTYPTPISKTVLGREVHFELSDNRVSHVPMDELVDMLKRDAEAKIYRLRELPEITETIGPMDGYRLRYTLIRTDSPMEIRSGVVQVVTRAELDHFTLIPVAADRGEPLETALGAQSQFRAALRGFDPRRTTVTLWVYPDAFAAFRRLKEELYGLGYSVAGRPLPDGHPIGGSPSGSRSAAQ